MLNSRYLLSSTQRAQSKNSNLSHHQQRGIVTNLPLAFYGICPKLYSSILFLKSNLIFSWWSAQLSQPDGHFPWISQPDWKIWNWLCGGRTCIELCRGWPGTSRHHLPPPSMYLHPPSTERIRGLLIPYVFMNKTADMSKMAILDHEDPNLSASCKLLDFIGDK